MNKQGQSLGIGAAIIVAVFIFIVGISIVNFMQSEVTTARTDLGCSDTSISDGAKLTCLVVDVVVPYFIVIVLSLAGGGITAKLLV